MAGEKWESPKHLITIEGLEEKVDAKRRKGLVNSLTKDKSKKSEKVMNDLFLSSLGDEEVVQPVLSGQKKKKGQRQTLQESLHTLNHLNRIAQTQPSSPKRAESQQSSFVEQYPSIQLLNINDDGASSRLKVVNSRPTSEYQSSH